MGSLDQATHRSNLVQTVRHSGFSGCALCLGTPLYKQILAILKTAEDCAPGWEQARHRAVLTDK